MSRSLLLLAGLVAMSYGLTCQKCSQTIMKIAGFALGDGTPSQDAKCVQKTCGEGEDVCTYGYATISFKGAFSLTGEANAPEVEMEILMDWFKDCGKSAEASCDNISDMLTMLQGDDKKSKISVSKCDIKSCNTDDCNDKTVKEINPSPLKDISCYTCKKSKVNGGPNTDTSDPDQPECSESHKKKCPLGTELCLSGNIGVNIGDNKMEVEYFKDCGNSNMGSCDAFEEMMKKYGALSKDVGTIKLNSCNIESCKGDLCNTKNAKEVSAYSGGTSLVVNCFLASILVYLWF